MSIIENILNIGKPAKIKEPIFIKKFDYCKQISDLERIEKIINNEKIKKAIKKDIAFLKKGNRGEEKINFQIKNLFENIICLHDIRIEYKNYVAQFDFIIITNKSIYVLESKALNGDIYINSEGDFIRNIKDKQGHIIKKEGMYNPVAQNLRHIKILNKVLIENGINCTAPIESVILIANDKSIINKSSAPYFIKRQVIKYDQLDFFIQNDLKKKTDVIGLNEKRMDEIALFLKEIDKPITFDYKNKYNIKNKDIIYSKEDLESIKNGLKKYRLNKSKEKNIKPYFIFNDKTLEYLILTPIDSIDELSLIPGFGKKRCEEYGQDILNIFNNKKNELI